METLLSSLESAAQEVAKLQPKAELLARWADKLLASGPAQRMFMVANPKSFGHPALVPHLIERGKALRHDDPHRALDAYLAATQVAGFLPSQPHYPHYASYHADLYAEALANLANGQRAVGRFSQAQRTLNRAKARARWGSGNALLEAFLSAMTGALDVDLGHYEAADLSFRWAIDLYVDLEEHERAGRAMLALGRCLFLAGDYEPALHFLHAGLADVDMERDPLLFLTVVVGKAKTLAHIGRPDEGLALLGSELEEYLEEDLGRVSFARLNLLRGELAAAAGQPHIAVRKFARAQRLFAEIDLPEEAALASLEVAALFAEAGEFSLVSREVTRALAILRGSGAGAYGEPALRRLAAIAKRKAASAAVVRYVARRLRGEAARR